MTKLGIVGLGRMGSRMANRLLDRGYEVIVWNRSPEPVGPIAARGATVAATPSLVAERTGAVIIMVSDPRALRDVTEGSDGVASGLAAGTSVIQMSTVGVPATLRLAAALPDGVLLDAPVLGSIAEVEAGKLTIFVGGPDERVQEWLPMFSALGRPLHVGSIGAGSAAKLVANLTLFGMVSLLGEALALADGLGLPREKAFEVLAATPLAAQAERRRAAIESGDFPSRFALSLGLKDIELILEATSGTDLRLTNAARSWLADADGSGWGEKDYASLIAFILEQGLRENHPAA
jgi:3-hydroxyisobutyrate dehydrogenase/2-hydroxy-3-oxopropionate reductase